MGGKIKINITHVIVALIIGIAILLSTYLNISYKNKALEAEQTEKQERKEEIRLNRRMLEACLSDSFGTYREARANECSSRGLKDDCRLPVYVEDDLRDYLKELKDECFKRYPLD